MKLLFKVMRLITIKDVTLRTRKLVIVSATTIFSKKIYFQYTTIYNYTLPQQTNAKLLKNLHCFLCHLHIIRVSVQ